MAASGWYYVKGDGREGPVDRAEMLRLIAVGHISGDTLVWTSGLSGWENLSDHFPSAPADTPPPIPAVAKASAQQPPPRTKTTEVPAGDSFAAPSRAFRQAVGTCLRKYGVIRGRASRSEFWNFLLFGLFTLAAVGAVCFLVDPNNDLLAGKALGAAMMALMTPMLSVSIRRLHDIGRTGWWTGILIVPPLVAFLGMVVLVSLGGALFPGALPATDVLAGKVQAIAGAIQTPTAAEAVRNEVLATLALAGVQVYALALLVFHCQKGTAGANRFG